MHNFPGQDLGTFEVCAGPCMAAADTIDITLRGQGTHAAFPHQGRDVIVKLSHDPAINGSALLSRAGLI